jgi:hypothetical protein
LIGRCCELLATDLFAAGVVKEDEDLIGERFDPCASVIVASGDRHLVVIDALNLIL